MPKRGLRPRVDPRPPNRPSSSLLHPSGRLAVTAVAENADSRVSSSGPGITACAHVRYLQGPLNTQWSDSGREQETVAGYPQHHLKPTAVSDLDVRSPRQTCPTDPPNYPGPESQDGSSMKDESGVGPVTRWNVLTLVAMPCCVAKRLRLRFRSPQAPNGYSDEYGKHRSNGSEQPLERREVNRRQNSDQHDEREARGSQEPLGSDRVATKFRDSLGIQRV